MQMLVEAISYFRVLRTTIYPSGEMVKTRLANITYMTFFRIKHFPIS